MKADQDLLRGGVNVRMNEVTGQAEHLRKEIMDLVQKANAGVVKSVDERLDSLDVAIGAMFMRIEELEKRASPAQK